VRCLERIEQQKSVPKLLLKQALNQKQFVDYIESYDFQITHAEDELTEGMPDELIDFARMVKEGDKYNALADRFSKSKNKNIDHLGKTTSERLRNKAESCYESASMFLNDLLEPIPGLLFDPTRAHKVLMWLDRDVGTEYENRSGADCVSTARIRGSKSKYSQKRNVPIWGVRVGKYWRQREAVVKATMLLLYGEEVEVKTENAAVVSHKLREILNKMRDEEY
jgi:hypothetical protein